VAALVKKNGPPYRVPLQIQVKYLMYLKASINYLQLCKTRVSLFAALSAVGGFFLAKTGEQFKIIALFAGVLLLAAGSSALNQYQERATDALMDRTKDRPIPLGRITPLNGFAFSVTLMAVGIGVLYVGCGLRAAVLGLFASAWYNGVYTTLKRKTAFAAVPGALTGALPPAVGWAAAGGDLWDPHIPALCLFFAIWQVPHFWLFLMDYGKQYEEAGLPSVTRIFQRNQMSRIIFHWIAATALSGLALCVFGFAQSPLVRYPILAASAWLVCIGIKFMVSKERVAHATFGKINLYMVIVMVLLISDALFASQGLRKYYVLIP
jgi:heme o synthase